MPHGQPSDLELSIVMPCLNEAETLETCVRKAQRFLREHQVAGEVLAADNGSTDGSQAVAIRAGARVVAVAAEGYGSALAGGIAAAGGRFVIMGDADDSYDFTQLAPFLDALRRGEELVIGNRFQGGIKPGAMSGLHWLGNRLLSGAGRLFFQSPVGDFHCGLRGFSKAAALRLNLRTTGMEFASELIVKATLLGLRVTEVPTVLWPAGRRRPPHLRPWRDGWRHLRFLLLYSPRWLFFYPGILLMLGGVVAACWLLPGPRTVGGLTLDVHTLLYAAVAILIGFQAVSFAAFTHIFAMVEELRPGDPRLERLFRFVTLEVGLLVGAILVIAGLVASVGAVTAWAGRSFGPLDPVTTLRLVIPGVTSLALGCHVVLSSFFLSALGLRRR
mgnify:CR=1 FL=1